MYEKSFEYESSSGEKRSVKLKPLQVKYLGKMWGIVGKLQSATKDKEDFSVSDISEEAINGLSELCIVTVKRSTDWKDEEVDDFVSVHFFDLFPVIIDLNLNKQK